MCKKRTLCWNCSKATGGCSWSKSLLPVDGWDAEETDVSFKVNACPEFEKDNTKKVPVKNIAHLPDYTFKTLDRYINEEKFEDLNQLLFDEHYRMIERLKSITPHLKN